MKFIKISLPVLLLAMTSSCIKKADTSEKYFSDPMLYCSTVKKLNNVVLENNFPPMIGSRNYAYANIAAYECMAAGNKQFRSLAGQVNQLPPMPVPGAGKRINFNLAALLAFTKLGNAVTFPEGSLMAYYEELKHNADSVGMPADVLENTLEFSDLVAAAIMRWSKKDKYAQTRTAERYFV